MLLIPLALFSPLASKNDDADSSGSDTERAESSNPCEAPFPYVQTTSILIPSGLLCITITALLLLGHAHDISGGDLVPLSWRARTVKNCLALKGSGINLGHNDSSSAGPRRVHFHVGEFGFRHLLEEDLGDHVLVSFLQSHGLAVIRRLDHLLGDQGRVLDLPGHLDDLPHQPLIRGRRIELDRHGDDPARRLRIRGRAPEVIHVEDALLIRRGAVPPGEDLVTLIEIKIAIDRQQLPLIKIHFFF